MRILLDTHAFIWFAEDDVQLNQTIKETIEKPTNNILLSIASIWEMAIKCRNFCRVRFISFFVYKKSYICKKEKIMATYNITINERTKAGKRLVALLKSLNEVVSLSKVNKVTAMDEALDDKENGRVFEAKNAADLINKCLS